MSVARFFQRLWKKQSTNDRIASYIQKHFGYYPKDTSLYQQALRHSSAVRKGAKGIHGSNERLEFLGDAVLDIIVAEYLYREHEDMSEGELTKMKAKVVSRKMLNIIGDDLEIVSHLHARLGKQPVHRSMIGNALEALIGAMYLDKGYRFTTEKVLDLLKKHNVDQRVHTETDFKSKLHEWCQKQKISLSFDVIRENPVVDAPDRYEIVVVVDGEARGRGKGKSKKSAEQIAARQACEVLCD